MPRSIRIFQRKVLQSLDQPVEVGPGYCCERRDLDIVIDQNELNQFAPIQRKIERSFIAIMNLFTSQVQTMFPMPHAGKCGGLREGLRELF